MKYLSCTNISFSVPTGYDLEGLENLNQSIENKYGGFTGKAKLEGDRATIETIKHYDVNYVPKEDWQSIVKFLNGAYNFAKQKLLFRKKQE